MKLIKRVSAAYNAEPLIFCMGVTFALVSTLDWGSRAMFGDLLVSALFLLVCFGRSKQQTPTP